MNCLPYSAGEHGSPLHIFAPLPPSDEGGEPSSRGSEGEISHFSPPVFLLRKNPAPSSEGASTATYLLYLHFNLRRFPQMTTKKRDPKVSLWMCEILVPNYFRVNAGHSARVVGTTTAPDCRSALAASTASITSAGSRVLVGAMSTPPLLMSYTFTPAA